MRFVEGTAILALPLYAISDGAKGDRSTHPKKIDKECDKKRNCIEINVASEF